MSVKVKIEDLGLSTLAALLGGLSKMKASAGIHATKGAEAYDQGQTIAEVAIYQEFGTQDIPARSFVRSTAYEKGPEIAREAKAAFAKAFERLPKTPAAGRERGADALAQVGQVAADLMRAKIDTARNWAKPNAPSTIRKKGFDLPLIDTGKLRDAITFEVHARGSKVREGDAK